MTVLEKNIYNLLISIPVGRVTTYSELARAVGRPRAARAVGNALKKNLDAPHVPCHRVIRASGEIGGYVDGAIKKIKLLIKEGVSIKNGRVENYNDIIYKFKKT